jgi:tetratricopeptide (TPR) repeat protein
MLLKEKRGSFVISNTWSNKRSKKTLIISFVIVMLAGILYFNSLGNQFTNWDDGMIYQNSTIRNLNWSTVQKIFAYEKANTYQPIRMLSYAVDYKFWKLNPLGYHITNILFYILTCITVFFSLKILSEHLREKAATGSHLRVALFGSLLYAAHPVHVEAVTWLAARKEVLQGFFFFLAFYLYLKGSERENRQRMAYFGLVLFSLLLAILSKPAAVVFPGVVLVYEIARRRGGVISFLKKHWAFVGLSLALSAIFIFILMKVMFEAGGVKHYKGFGIGSNILVCLYVFLHSIKLLIFTINYSAAYSFVVSMPVFCLKNVILMLITFSLFAIGVLSLRRTKIIFFSLFFFLVTLLPYLNIIPISTLKADRYVFIASFSFALLMGVAFDRLYAFRHEKCSEGFFKLLSATLFLFLLTGYSFMTIRQNTIWENSYTLWSDAVEKHPESSVANALMGVVYMQSGMDREAVKYLEKAVHLFPFDYLSRNNLGIVYGRLDEPERALEEFAAAMQLRPDDDAIKINLSIFYQRQGEYEKAEEVLKYLLSKSPQNANLHYRLGLIYKDAGQYEAAVSELLKSMKLAPHIINPYEDLGDIYLSRLNDIEKAKYYYLKGIESGSKAVARIEDLRWMIQDIESHQ